MSGGNGLTIGGHPARRLASFAAGLGMVVFSLLTIRHFFEANYPDSIFAGSFCDISAFFNCDSSAYSSLSTLFDVPLGVPGLVIGALVMLGAVFPSETFERTNRFVALVNGLGVVALFLLSVFVIGSLCLLCTGYYIASLVSLWLFWRYPPGRDDEAVSGHGPWLKPSLLHLSAFAVFGLATAWGFAEYHQARRDAQSGGASARFVRQYYELPEVAWPSSISQYRTASATPEFEEAPIRIVEYADLLCSDCRILDEQLKRLKREFPGKLNVAFQFFPLDASCNDVVEKDKHPGACELSYMAAHEAELFPEVHRRVFENFEAAKKPEWRSALAHELGLEGAVNDSVTRSIVHRLIQTGREYEQTSDQYSYGIRSTPTMIINNRLVIGTFPDAQMRELFQALIDEAEGGERTYLENWVE
ncbi:MAG: thioredoxin domain-containing protein [marine benthic group bacterium]|nr:thioredoxin domain-containing protein [Candidatus Carthagonibacter metallireducens]